MVPLTPAMKITASVGISQSLCITPTFIVISHPDRSQAQTFWIIVYAQCTLLSDAASDSACAMYTFE